ncbi:MAG: PepSY domain-containing protein [Verrucomicrobia bacterium]|nr:PepSY domain-containing protein [Verrucomicrobiota bacterium]
MSLPSSSTTPPAGALYRAVWRWHFFAGLFVAPFAVFLAVTGAIYLWKPQYEAWRYRELFKVPVPAGQAALSADAQFTAARAAYPQLSPIQFVPGVAPGRSAEVQFGSARGPDRSSVFVNPYTGAVLGRLDDADRLMTTVSELHGTLLAGTPGQIVVELAATWAIVLIVSGLYLWWPRPFSLRGFLLPRLGAGRRALLRDLHAVPAVWLSLGLLFLLSTGLQWTKVTGAWARWTAQAAGQWTPRETSASAHRSAVLGGWSPPVASRATARGLEGVASTPPAADPHAEHRARATAWRDDPRRISLEQVRSVARERGVTDPYAIVLPSGPTGVFSIITDRNRPFSRAFIHLDQYSGKILADVRFKDFGLMGKFYSAGIIAHEGQLFGLANQLLGLAAALGVILLAVTGVLMWWARRPRGQLAAPAGGNLFRTSRGAVVVAVLLSAVLPLMAATLVLLLLLDATFVRYLSRPESAT